MFRTIEDFDRVFFLKEAEAPEQEGTGFAEAFLSGLRDGLKKLRGRR